MSPVRLFREVPCAVLLAVQAIGVLLYPSLTGHTGRQMFAVFGVVVLALAVYAVRATPSVTWVAASLAIPATVLLIAQIVTDNSALVPWASGFEATLYGYASVAMIRYMLADDELTNDELFAVGAVFTLAAWGFAHLFVVLQYVDHGAFGEQRTWMELLFVSFTILSSTGLSDIVPVSAHARSLVMIEQVGGIFYMAMVVTRLVTLRRAKKI